MTRILIITSHPSADSFTLAVAQLAKSRAKAVSANVELIHLDALEFEPAMPMADWTTYTNGPQPRLDPLTNALRNCDTVLFVFPTWWHAPPARLKGWLDRVLVPGFAFHLPDKPGGVLAPGLTHITRLGVLTTHGGTWLQTLAMGFPVRRLFLTALARLCSPKCARFYSALYRMDETTPDSRRQYLDKTARKLDSFLKPPR